MQTPKNPQCKRADRAGAMPALNHRSRPFVYPRIVWGGTRGFTLETPGGVPHYLGINKVNKKNCASNFYKSIGALRGVPAVGVAENRRFGASGETSPFLRLMYTLLSLMRANKMIDVSGWVWVYDVSRMVCRNAENEVAVKIEMIDGQCVGKLQDMPMWLFGEIAGLKDGEKIIADIVGGAEREFMRIMQAKEGNR